MLPQLAIFALFVWSAGSAATTDRCPDTVARNNKYYLQVHGDKCYFFVLFKSREFVPAQKYCQRLGGNLVMVKSEGVNNFIQRHLKYTYTYRSEVWIGLHDSAVEGRFQWVDGSRLAYNNFASNEGTKHGFSLLNGRGSEDCIAIDPSVGGKWRDYRCSTSFFFNEHKPFICEFKTSPKTTTKLSTTLLTSAKPQTHSSKGTTYATTKLTSAPTTTASPATPQVLSALTTPSTLPTTTATTTKPATTQCPSLVCDLDCDFLGFQVDPVTKCMICACNE